MILGISVDGGEAAAVLIEPDGSVIARADAHRADANEALTEIARAALALTGGAHPSAIGVSFPDPDPSSWPASLGVLSESIGSKIPIKTLSLGNASALAEVWYGCGKGARDLIAFSVRTFVSAGVISNGALLSGSHGLASSVQWLALNPVEREDYRRLGCLQAEGASGGIVRRHIWRVKSGDHSWVLDAVAGDFGAITLDHILEAARGGDGVSGSVIRDTVKYLAMAVSNIAAVVDPEMIVLDGIPHTASDLLLEPMRQECGRRMPPGIFARVKIELSALGVDSAPIGAARFAQFGPQLPERI